MYMWWFCNPDISDFSTRTETTWERLRSTSPETPPIKITRLTSPLSLPSSASFPSANVEKVSNRSHKIRNHAMDGMDNKPVLNDDPSVTLTIRLIMQGKVSYPLYLCEIISLSLFNRVHTFKLWVENQRSESSGMFIMRFNVAHSIYSTCILLFFFLN